MAQNKAPLALGEKVASWKDAPDGNLFSSAALSSAGRWLRAGDKGKWWNWEDF